MGENAAIKMARNDIKWAKKNEKECFAQGVDKENPYLTSGCMLPFSEDNFSDQIENAAEFQGYATSGSILHHFIESNINPKILANYVDKLLRSKPMFYITLSNTLANCMNCGTRFTEENAGKLYECPICKSDDIAIYGRIIGYVKPISRKNVKVDKSGYIGGDYNFWSKARRGDWVERKKIKLEDVTKEM